MKNTEAPSISHRRGRQRATGPDDASACRSYAGFVIGMDQHDRATGLTAFEAALAIIPSSALTYLHGSTILAFSAAKA